MENLPEFESEPRWLSIWKTYKFPIILGGISLLCIAVSLILLIKSVRSTSPIQFSHNGIVEGVSNQKGQSANEAKVTVDVEGAVKNPGIYAIPAGGRVGDAITAAGGLTENADIDVTAQTINRAMKAADGMKIYIPMTSHTVESQGNTLEMSHNLGTAQNGQAQNGAVISVNFASESDLDALPGVGPVTAQKIIDNRPYASLDDLVAKKAMGPSLFAKLKNRLSL